MIKIALVVPCYNEQETLVNTNTIILNTLNNLKMEQIITKDSYVCYVNDGSDDNTWNTITELYEKYKEVKAISFNKNYGHQSALLAGLKFVYEDVDAAITIDADLQDDIECIEDMVNKYQTGADIVFGIRKSRNVDKFIKKQTARLFYKLMQLLGTNIVENHADYRLMSKKAIGYLLQFEENNLFLRGIISNLGFKTDKVYYDRKERKFGTTKYTLSKMINLSMNGITSFSAVPLRLITYLGFLSILIAIILTIKFLIDYFMFDVNVKGWTSLMLSIWFIGGIQLISLSIIGEYISKIFTEVKNRPKYFIEKELK